VAGIATSRQLKMPASIGSKMPASMAQAYQLRCEPKHEGATGLAHCPPLGLL